MNAAMLRAVIADDDAPSARLLERALADTGEAEVLGSAHCAEGCVELCVQLAPDVAFLDIAMPGVSGLVAAERLHVVAPRCRVVFVTAYEDYALDAFGVGATDYIVKTPHFSDFRARVAECVRRLRAVMPSSVPSEAMAGTGRPQAPTRPTKLAVRDREEQTVRVIDVKDIVYIERTGRTTTVVSREGEFATYHSICELDEWLRGGTFFRTGRRAIINLDYVRHLVPNGDGSYDVVVAVDGDQTFPGITVARSRSQLLLKVLAPPTSH